MPEHADGEPLRRDPRAPRACRPPPRPTRRGRRRPCRSPGDGATSRAPARRAATPSRVPSFTSTSWSANSPGVCLCFSSPTHVRQMLDEVAAAGDVQHLRAAADGEHRHVAVERRAQERELAAVALRPRPGRLRMRIVAVLGGSMSEPPEKSTPSSASSVSSIASSLGRHEQRPAAGRLDHLRRRPAGSPPPARPRRPSGRSARRRR